MKKKREKCFNSGNKTEPIEIDKVSIGVVKNIIEWTHRSAKREKQQQKKCK